MIGPEQPIGHFVSGTYLLFLYLFTCCCVAWLWEKHPGSLPGTQIKRASFEASAVVLATREMFARVCSRKMMGPSHAYDFLATTKVRIQLWSSLNRCLGQSSQRGTTDGAKGIRTHQSSPPSTGCPLWLRVVQQMAKLNQHPPAYHPVDAHDDFQWYDSSF